MSRGDDGLAVTILGGTAALLVAALSIAACSPAGEQDKTKAPGGPVQVSPKPFTSDVGEIFRFETTIDGAPVTCLVYDGNRAGGLHCFRKEELK